MPHTTAAGRTVMAPPTTHGLARNLAVIPSVFIVLGRRIATVPVAATPRAAVRPAVRHRPRRLGAWLERRSQRRQITKTGLVPITPKTFEVDDATQDLASNVASVDLGDDDVSAPNSNPLPCLVGADALQPTPCHDADQLLLGCVASLPRPLSRSAGCVANDRLGDGDICWHPT